MQECIEEVHMSGGGTKDSHGEDTHSDVSQAPLTKEEIKKQAESVLDTYEVPFIIQSISQCLDDIGIMGENLMEAYQTPDKEYHLSDEPTDYRLSTILKEAQNVDWTGRSQKAIDCSNNLMKSIKEYFEEGKSEGSLFFANKAEHMVIEHALLIQEAYDTFSSIATVNALKKGILKALEETHDPLELQGIETKLNTLKEFEKMAEEKINHLLKNPQFKINVNLDKENSVNPEFKDYEHRTRAPSRHSFRGRFSRVPTPPPTEFINDIRSILRAVNVMIGVADKPEKQELKQMQVLLSRVLATAERPGYKVDLNAPLAGKTLGETLQEIQHDFPHKKEAIWDKKKESRHPSEREQVEKGLVAVNKLDLVAPRKKQIKDFF